MLTAIMKRISLDRGTIVYTGYLDDGMYVQGTRNRSMALEDLRQDDDVASCGGPP